VGGIPLSVTTGNSCGTNEHPCAVNVHTHLLRLPLSARHPASLLSLAAAGTLLLTAYTLLLHGLSGRATPLLLAVYWSTGSVVAWCVAGTALLGLVERRAFIVGHGPLRRAAEVVCASLLAIAFASLLRSLLLPVGDRSLAALADAAWRLAARWSAPGLVVSALLVLASHPRWRAPASDMAGAPDGPIAPAPALPAPTHPAVSEPAPLVLRDSARAIVLAQADITLFVANGNYVNVFARGSEYSTRGTLHGLAALLDPGRFIRIHRTMVVAADAVRELRTPRDLGATAVLTDGRVVPVSRTGVRALREWMSQQQ
jgi:hypothetical protein